MPDDDQENRTSMPADVLSAGLGLLLLVVGSSLAAVALGYSVLTCLAAGVLAAGAALLAWAYLP